MSPITLTVELTDDAQAWELAQFIKRLRFDQCYELTEAWQSRAERQEQAYRMLNALDHVRDALEVAGFAPR
jgi:hypothetical protein